MKTVIGDLIYLTNLGMFDVVVHGCNCFCVMGAGVAKLIKTEFPEAYEADLNTKKGDITKLGTISYAHVHRGGRNFVIVNGYTQYDWRGNGVLVDYSAVRSVMKEVKALFSGKRIGYPRIGAGLARGDWETISEIIGDELCGEDHTLVEYFQGERNG